MLRFWQNPEFIRHRRAELRPARALTVVFVVAVICLLVGLACWTSYEHELESAGNAAVRFGGDWVGHLNRLETEGAAEAWRGFYRVLMLLQAGVLTFWSLLSCAQAVSGEREHKTWDFQRTTRLTAAELAVGKLLGEPVLAYFIVLCCFPIALLAGLAGKLSLLSILSAYLLIVACALFLGLSGLWLSSLLETRSRGLGMVGSLGVYILIASAVNFRRSPLPGLGAFSPLADLLPRLGMDSFVQYHAALFGHAIPWLAMSLILYVTFGAWLALMLVRNLKRDYPEMRLLSRWQAVGCAAFLNFIVYALFWPNAAVTPQDFATLIAGINIAVLFAIGLATLTPHERLKVWWRMRAAKQATLFSDDGLSWPWLALSAVAAYGLMVWGLLAWQNTLGSAREALVRGAVQLLVVLVFVTRDVLFIQWCKLTALRAPRIKGSLYLGLYYVAATVLSITLGVQSENAAHWAANLLTPAAIFDPQIYGVHYPASVFLGLGLQLAAIGFLMMTIAGRLRRPVAAAAMAGD